MNFVAAGDVDVPKLLSSREALVEQFYETTGRRDITFGDLVSVSKYRSVFCIIHFSIVANGFGREGRTFVWSTN